MGGFDELSNDTIDGSRYYPTTNTWVETEELIFKSIFEQIIEE